MIRSTFSGFSMAQQALSANQRAIDVAGHNLSNVNTPGYTRQRLDLATIRPVGLGSWSSSFDNKVGQGVMVTGISQIRDPYLDIQYRNQLTKVGTADATDKILEQLGGIFDEVNSTGIREAFNNVISQLKSMANNSGASEGSSDSMVRSAFQVLLNVIHEKGTALGDVEKELVLGLENDVRNINSCIDQIVKLNDSITNSQVLGNPALELLDQRNMLLDDLATYLPIDISYDKGNAGGQSVDVLNVTFKDGAGNVHSLISGGKGADFNLETTDGKRPVSLKIQDADPLAPGDLNDLDVSEMLQNGVLKGSFDMLNKSEVFDTPPSDTKGIGYYSSMFDQFVSKLAEKLNELNATTEKDPVTGVETTVYHNLFETTNADGKPPFTASNIKISEAWMNGSVTLTKTKNPDAAGGDGAVGYDNIQSMINAISSDKQEYTIKDQNGIDVVVFRGTMQQCYDNIQTTQAIDGKASSAILKNHISVLNQIADNRDSVSGVSEDEEVMDLMRYKQSFNAASRLMTTMDEMLDKLINSTGIVGR